MVYSRYYHRRKILNMMENVLPRARLLLIQMRADNDRYYKNRNFCILLQRKINFIEEGMRHRRLCANEEYLRIDDDYIKNELTNEIPELMEQLRVLLSRRL